MTRIQIGIRFPLDVKEFIDEQAERNCCSANSEVIRAIREKMDRVTLRQASQTREAAE